MSEHLGAAVNRTPGVERVRSARRTTNRLLARLPDEAFKRLAPQLSTILLKRRQVLHMQGQRLAHVFFPNDGVMSMTIMLSDGTSVEAATVGDEGMIGMEAFFCDDPVSAGTTMLQVPGTDIERLPVEGFRHELNEYGAFHELMGRYARITLAQVLQSAACNARHDVQARCCRWLLNTYDRMHGKTFYLSHEFLAMMLGVRRSTVSVIAGGLQRAGSIDYSHGHVTVLNRSALEAGTCECYFVVRKLFDNLDA
jgi:CRP-like cAMP-binding protein